MSYAHRQAAGTASRAATDTLPCPRCGAPNEPHATNCKVCRINLAFARENPAAIEHLPRESVGRPQGQQTIRTSSMSQPLLLPVLLLLASFVFSLCLGEAVHEFGHWIAHQAYGNDVGIRLDPFGGSRILGGSLTPRETWGITSAAGPLLNVVAALAVTLALWRWRRPALLPLLLWGPIALVQEGVTFSLGLLTAGGDAALIVESGVPASILLATGILFLVSGVASVCSVLPLAGLSPSASFASTFTAVAGGMVSFMLVRLLGSSVTSPGQAGENVLPLLFALLLAAAVAALYQPVHRLTHRLSEAEPARVSRFAVIMSAALGLVMVILQLAGFNGWGNG